MISVIIFQALQIQGQEAPKMGFRGNAGLFYDFYHFDADQYPQFRPRYPEHLVRFSASAALTVGSNFSMPFSIDLTNQSQAAFLPNLPGERFIDYVQNPRNNLRISPTWKWIGVHLGTHTPNYSQLTTGDIPIFGAGVDLRPGKFFFSASYGTSQVGMNADPFSEVAGAFTQRILASRTGIGQEDGNRFAINMVHLRDDVNSIDSFPLTGHPREGITVSPQLQLRIAKSVFLKTETAASVHTYNLLAPRSNTEIPGQDLLPGIITLNASTYTDISSISSLEWRSSQATVGGEVRYIGAGFMPAGYRVMETDLIDYNLKTNLKLFDNKLFFTGTGGLRTNNLSSTKLDPSTRFIANLSLFARITEAVSLSGLYTNFGFRNNVLFDTLRVEMIQNLVSITPALRISGDAVSHLIQGGPSLQYFEELNAATGEKLNTRSETYNLSYNLVFNRLPLNLGVLSMYLDNETPLTTVRIYHFGFTARYRMFNRRLTPSLMLTHSGIFVNQETPDNRIRLNLRIDYRLLTDLDLSLGYTLSHYEYGSLRPGASTLETRVQVSLMKRF